MADQPPSKAVLNYRAQRLATLTPAITKVICVVCYSVMWPFVAYFICRAAEVLAGRQTTAEFLVRLAGSVHADKYIAMIFGITGTAYGACERQLRKRTVAKLAERNAKLEKMIDPQRSSSGLPASGNTRRSDRP